MKLVLKLALAVLSLSAVFVGLANLALGARVLEVFLDLGAGSIHEDGLAIVDLQIRVLSGAWLALVQLGLGGGTEILRRLVARRAA